MTKPFALEARSAIRWAFALPWVALLWLSQPASATTPNVTRPNVTKPNMTKPNIVLILADDLGFSDLAAYGSEISTPSLDELADRGLRFTNYHTAASCAPTRGMLLTGVDSHRNGVPNIPEAIPPAQSEYEHYRGTLGHNVVTIATLLRAAGYHTYMAGKWHLGMTPDLLPSQRGFERAVAMADTGADNWQKKPYIPIYARANWFEDGEEIDLPDDFYSSKFFVDKIISYIESNRRDGDPFFAYLPFQAVHIPVQAPAEFTRKYEGKYDAGWTALRERRLVRAKAYGIVPVSTELAPVPTTLDWESLDDDEKRYASKKMAVYAGMIDAMDHHIGRLIAYLKQHDLYDDTIFIFTSDNGSEASDPLAPPAGALFKLWLAANDYRTDYETLGTKGSFVAIGASFASAAASPLAYYKFQAHEGGMRVPLMISGELVAYPGDVTNALAYVTDLAPTVLELAGVAPPKGSFAGRRVESISGKSLLPVVSGAAARIHGIGDAIGYELGGNSALFKGDFKLVRDQGEPGDSEWHLFNIVVDPGEAHDLRDTHPGTFYDLIHEYERYKKANNVLPLPDGYSQARQIILNGMSKRLGPMLFPGLVALAIAGASLIFWLRWRRSR